MTTKEIPDAKKTAEDWDSLPDVVILTIGIVDMLVCVKDGISTDEIEKVANKEHGTGISSGWSIDEDFSPHTCKDGRPDATHYRLTC